jgi:glycerol-3-phosphate dehydrogenase (NAD+)
MNQITIAAQVAEGVATAGAVIALAQKYNVKLPVLTAVAKIIDNELTPTKAVLELMNLPQVDYRFHRFPFRLGYSSGIFI